MKACPSLLTLVAPGPAVIALVPGINGDNVIGIGIGIGIGIDYTDTARSADTGACAAHGNNHLGDPSRP